MKKFIYNFSLFLIILIVYLIINQINEYNLYNRVCAFFLLIISVSYLFKCLISISTTSISMRIKNILTSILSSLIIIIFIELLFFFIPRSHFFSNTLASKNWHNYFSKPINSYGYHDYEPIQKKNTILFVGDSFTKGYGLKNVNDRFSNKINFYDRSLSCINIGMNGLDTKKEYINMLKFISISKIKPKHIILQYFGNDIEGIAYKLLKPKNKDPYLRIPKPIKTLVKGSYLVNYIFWLYPQEDYKYYLNYLKKAYSNPKILKEHLEDLNNFVEFSAKYNIKLRVLIFPFLVDTKMSDEIYEYKIKSFFKSKKIETLSVKELVKEIDKNLLIINKNDGHASILVNEIIAKKLYKTLKQS
jgi:lysophospholipase L1-like esterase